MTLLQQILAALNWEKRVNENFDSVSPAGLYGRNPATTTGLTWGYLGGNFNGVSFANGTVALTASNTNYVVAHRTTGAVTVATTTTNWLNSATYIQLYRIVVGASTVTSYDDFRQAFGMAGFTGGTLTGSLNEAPQVTIASAATVNIGAAAANSITVTGTTTITAFDTIATGAKRQVVFSGALTLTHNATSLILPTGANIATAAGDVADFVSLGSGNWRCVNYMRANGAPLGVATAAVLGGVKVGAGLAVAGDGTLSASGSAPGTQTITDFANAAGTTTGLTYGYQAGFIRADNVTTSVAAGTVALTASTTNYVEITSSGVVSANTTGFTSGRYPLAQVATGSSTITTITDKRGVIALGGVQLGGVNAFTKNQSVTPVANSSATGTVTPDASVSNSFQYTLTGNLTLANPTNLTAGMVLNFCLDQDGTGGRTITLGSLFKWPSGTAPTWTTTANAKNFFSGYYDGTIIRCGGGVGYA